MLRERCINVDAYENTTQFLQRINTIDLAKIGISSFKTIGLYKS